MPQTTSASAPISSGPTDQQHLAFIHAAAEQGMITGEQQQALLELARLSQDVAGWLVPYAARTAVKSEDLSATICPDEGYDVVRKALGTGGVGGGGLARRADPWKPLIQKPKGGRCLKSRPVGLRAAPALALDDAHRFVALLGEGLGEWEERVISGQGR